MKALPVIDYKISYSLVILNHNIN